MAVQPAGNEWLKQHYQLQGFRFTHSSFIGSNESIELTTAGNVEQIYRSRYAPLEDTPLLHLEFSLKYDDLDLYFLQTVFDRLSPEELCAFIRSHPAGKYPRRIGFLYEFLTRKELPVAALTKGTYIDAIDEEKYLTGTKMANRKWRINNNLPGTASFCPVVRKTAKLQQLLALDIVQQVENLKQEFPIQVFKRAISYLYKKETLSSFEIEKEVPSADRIERFVALLLKAGEKPVENVLEQGNLVQLQNAIVDARFAAVGFRDFQNYVGETLPNYEALIHYACPPPQLLPSLMDGLRQTAAKTATAPSALRAAVVSFGFVFLHPFEDGNGRLHRFLIHDVLVNGGLVPQEVIIPVSAHMLSHMKAYDAILEAYSKPLMQRVQYRMTDEGEMTITNPDEVAGYYRYPNLTAQCIYLIETLLATLQEDMPHELQFLQRYDEAKKALQHIVDMPDKEINRMLVFFHQNKGVFPKRRREYFSKLTDAEIAEMEMAFVKAFEG